jgi:hypothetical protein
MHRRRWPDFFCERASQGRHSQPRLKPLIGRIPVEQMRQANFLVDRDGDKASQQEAACLLAHAPGLPEP